MHLLPTESAAAAAAAILAGARETRRHRRADLIANHQLLCPAHSHASHRIIAVYDHAMVS